MCIHACTHRSMNEHMHMHTYWEKYSILGNTRKRPNVLIKIHVDS